MGLFTSFCLLQMDATYRLCSDYCWFVILDFIGAYLVHLIEHKIKWMEISHGASMEYIC